MFFRWLNEIGQMRMFSHLTYGFILLLLLLTTTRTYGQISYSPGIKGSVQDSLTHTVLSAATITVYLQDDSSLYTYQLADNKGMFYVAKLPADTILDVMVSYMGYRSQRKKVLIPMSAKAPLNLSFFLVRQDQQLDEVEVIPPVMMRGDTLEFYADAFAGKPNDVVGDLLRKLPGVVLWADGQITVNGKRVSQVLVDGKPFFTGDSRIVTDNLPKEVVDRVRVIPDQKKDVHPRMGETVTVDVTLKKDKKTGAFGKMGAAYGTDKRYDSDLMLNRYSPKTQLSLTGTTNNVNKRALSVDELMRASGYRQSVDMRDGPGPDFRQDGIAKLASGGVFIAQDLGKKTAANADLVAHRSQLDIARMEDSHTLLNDSVLDRHSRSNSHRENNGLAWGGTANFRDSVFHDVRLTFRRNSTNSNSHYSDSAYTQSSNVGLLNTSNQSNTTEDHYDLNNLQLHYAFKPEQKLGTIQRLGTAELAYALEDSHRSGMQIKHSMLFAPLENIDTSFFDRQGYAYQNQQVHKLYLRYHDLNRLIASHAWLAIGVDYQLYVKNEQANATVNDLNSETGQYNVTNAYLSHDTRSQLRVNQPALLLSKSFIDERSGLYARSLTFGAELREQLTDFKTQADHAFRRFDKRYEHFIPTLSVDYRSNRVGVASYKWGVQYNRSVEIPQLEQLAPLVDSTQQWYLALGNPQLQESRKDEIKGSFTVQPYREKGYLIWGGFSLGNMHDYWADSSWYDDGGRRYSTRVNLNGYRYIRGQVQGKKNYVLRGQQLQVYISVNMGMSAVPFVMNGSYGNSENRNWSMYADISYNLLEQLGVSAFYGQDHQHVTNETYRVQSRQTSGGGQVKLKCWSRLFFSNRIGYTASAYNEKEASHFWVWNSELVYRALNKNNLELKVIATDLLGQNQGVRLFSDENSLHQVQSNRLRRYVQFALAFYPRIF